MKKNDLFNPELMTPMTNSLSGWGSVVAILLPLVILAGCLGASESLNATAVQVTSTTIAATVTTTSSTIPASEPVDTKVVMLTAGSNSNGNPGAYTPEAFGERMVVSAAEEGPNGNQRTAIVFGDPEETMNQTQCATWDYESTFENQEGIVLRLASMGDGAYSAVSVTKNIFGSSPWVFNVHEWSRYPTGKSVSEREPNLSGRSTLDQFDMREAVKNGIHGADQTEAWSVCARAVDNIFEIKVWTESTPEPSWNNKVHVQSIKLPDTLMHVGEPAIYLGHLAPGDETNFSRIWRPETPSS